MINSIKPAALREVCGRANKTNHILFSLILAMSLVSLHEVMGAQAPINLGEATRFAVLAGSGITSIPTSAIKGDVGLSPAARADIAGLTPLEVNGSIFAADDGSAVAVMLIQAKGDLTTAYNDAAGRSLAPVDVANADLGGLTLLPGLYKSSGTLDITGDLTLDGQGNSNSVFIFQVATLLNTASGSKVILIGDARADNIYWQVGSSATLGTTTSFKGTIMADQSISLATGATLDGRALARIGAVTLDVNVINNPNPRPEAPRFGPVQRKSSGIVNLVITNTPGRVLTLQTSTNLTDWTTFATPTPVISPDLFTHATASNEPKRFYRAFYLYP